jgi:prophage antirepressor-like protein
MNEITVWNYENQKIRTITKNGVYWWILKDICDALAL